MLIDNWNPFFDVAKTLEEFDRMFGRVARPIGIRSVPRGTFPPINIYDQDDKVTLIAEVPGLEPSDIELTVHGDSVTLKCERQHQAREDERYHRRERATGTFSRIVTLPNSVDPDSVKAQNRNGLLTVKMKKVAEAKPKKIKIKS